MKLATYNFERESVQLIPQKVLFGPNFWVELYFTAHIILKY